MENNLNYFKQVYFLNISHICYSSNRKVVSPQTQAIGGTNIAVSGWSGCVKKEEQTLVSTDCLISTNAQFTQSTLTIVVLLIMKFYLFPPGVFGILDKSLALSMTPNPDTADRGETQSYFQFKIKVGFSCVTSDL